MFRRTKEAWTHPSWRRRYGDDRTPGIHRAVTEPAVRLTKSEARTTDRGAGRCGRRVAEADPGGEDDDRRTYHVLQIAQPFPDQPLGR